MAHIRRKKYTNDVNLYIEPSSTFISKSKDILNVLAPTFILLFAVIVLTLISTIVFTIFKVLSTQEMNNIDLVNLNIIISLLSIPLVLVLLKKFGKNIYPHFKSDISKNIIIPRNAPLILAVTVIYSILVQNVFNVLAKIPIFAGLMQSNVRESSNTVQLILLALISVLGAPLYEELMRFLIIKGLEKITKKIVIINIIQSLLFAIPHLNIFSIIIAFIAGLFLGQVQLKYNSLKFTTCIHMLFNLAAYIPIIPSTEINLVIIILMIAGLFILNSSKMKKKLQLKSNA